MGGTQATEAMKIPAIIAVLISLCSTLSLKGEVGIQGEVRQELRDAGFGITHETETCPIAKGGYRNTRIEAPRGCETLLHAVGIEPDSSFTIFVYNDANGNLVDTASSNGGEIICRFAPIGDLYRVKIKVTGAKTPTRVRLIAASRSPQAPPSTELIIASN